MYGFSKKLIDVGFFEAPAGQEVRPYRIQPELEVVELLTAGTICFDTASGERRCKAGSLFWHLPGEMTIHRYLPETPYQCYYFRFQCLQPERPGEQISLWNPPAEAELFGKEMFHHFHAGEDLESLGLYCYATLCRQARLAAGQSGESTSESLQNALRFIDRNSAGTLSVRDIADACMLSESHLYLLFRTHLGISPHRYLLQRRIERARMMLAGGSDSIKNIAIECGFESLEVFYRRFKDASGLTPAQYRRKYTAPYLIQEK